MDSMSVAARVAGAVTLVSESLTTGKSTYPAWEVFSLRFSRKTYSDLRHKFGTLKALFLLMTFPDAKHIVDRIEKHVLDAEADEPMMLRKSTSEDCTMLAVAGAIVAQVAITALGLAELDKVHWTAEAAFVASLAAGGLSVFCACLVQQTMSGLLTTNDVKDFFSQPNSSEKFKSLEPHLDQLISDMTKESPGDEQSERHRRMTELESMIKQFKNKNKWKSASFPSILMVKAPTLLLKCALIAFIIGLGIYYGCLAFSDVGSAKSRISYFSIFIIYMMTVFVGYQIYHFPSMMKELELAPARRYAQIMTNELVKPQRREETKILQNIRALLNPDEQEANREHPSDDAMSWEGRLEDMDRPRYDPPHDNSVERSNKSAGETAECVRSYTV
ncbi:hypothetical protein P168DRAFT_344868 [Aspergillus campestris IBT 28561]|uniref:Uncharacterized protein n=1 Tax=Aspergillus campestris (strain IBT 28561) TaxID=1392248 RepID=A0A2I1D1I9_ASPC2|nr:uncharacterized protein P168DRAFT_344868 [Aspergillus campestris IBT 28561]PKY03727.1 hypothetical protein P168DRAFT_344868 [Aspergillus campestris IBT 28561]